MRTLTLTYAEWAELTTLLQGAQEDWESPDAFPEEEQAEVQASQDALRAILTKLEN